MSAGDIVASDYGLTDTKPAGPEKERRIWETTSVAPDPHQPGYFYATQRLAGRYGKMPHIRPDADLGRERDPEKMWEYIVGWIPADKNAPPVTRVLYCTMDDQGRMINAFKNASQGKSGDAE